MKHVNVFVIIRDLKHNSTKNIDFYDVICYNTTRREFFIMETRVAIIGIIISDAEQVGRLNEILHEYGEYIIGRMGIPYRKKGIHIISVAVDAPQNVISALSGKIGRLKGISAKTAYSDVITKPET